MNRHTLLTSVAAMALAVATAACTGAADDPLGAPDQNGTHQNGHPVAAAPVDAAGGAGGTGGASGATGQAVQEITIVAQDAMRFDPSTFTVEAGRPVRLTLRNEGQATHDFSLSQGVPRPVKVEARGGQSASVTFTIPRPGTYQFSCAQLGHAMARMRGTITATAPGGAGTAG
jgi:uncharacterized cupredoxin-like copper-binding protein